MSVSLDAIAKKAKVSRMTVSRALRNHNEVSEATKARILKIAEKMGYRPNPLVSVWMSHVVQGKTRREVPRLAFISGYSDDESRLEMVHKSGYYKAAKKHAARYGFEIDAYSMFYKEMNPKRLSDILKARACPGCLIAPMKGMLDSIKFDWDAFSNVAIGYTLKSPDFHRVVTNHGMQMRRILEFLLDNGRNRIGLALRNISDERSKYQWSSNYLGHLNRKVGFFSIPTFIYPEFEYEKFEQWYLEYRPQAVIGVDDIVLDWMEALASKHRADFFHLHAEYATDSRIAGTPTSTARHVAETAINVLIGQIHRNERGIPKELQLTLVPCGFELRHSLKDLVPVTL